MDTNIFSKETLEKLDHLFEITDKCRTSYFWEGGCASERKWKENRYTVDEITWVENGVEYSASHSCSCSRAHVYTSGHYYKDGIRTTLTAIKASYRRMQKVLPLAN